MSRSLAIQAAMAFLFLPAFAIAAGPSFTVNLASSTSQSGELVRMEKDWSVVLAGQSALPGADLILLRREGTALPSFPAGPQIVFVNGDRLAGQVVSIERGEVRFKAAVGSESSPDALHEITIPLSALSVIWFRTLPPDSGELLMRRWASERRRRDVVLLNNGDMRTGVVAGMRSPTSPFLLQEDGKETRIDSGHLVALAVNTDLARTLRPRGVYGRLVLANGGRIALLSATADPLVLTGKTLFGAEVKIPVDRIVSLDIRQGKATYLSDLKPKRYEHTPFLGVRWPHEMDRSVAGNEMRLARHTYDKGVGLHSESRLTFDLGGSYRRFESTVGLDDRTGQGGSVRIRVLVDGQAKEVGDKELTSATGPRVVSVDVTGAKELMLIVEFGSGGDVCDHVDWAEAKVIK
jgi:hypothetical protein